jgi:ribosomal protein L37AE/L43A
VRWGCGVAWSILSGLGPEDLGNPKGVEDFESGQPHLTTMAGTVTYKGVKRFGARYGRRIRQKLGKIEADSRAYHKCPYCHYKNAKKVAVGIFVCSKCKAKFASSAYAPLQKKQEAPVIAQEEETQEEPVEEEEEVVEDG